ncbi:nuclear transport factor 2 family protein [Aliagarivorans marinus]|uniref:nuclear transport factor 2 family protein n=1 Tax=Aliagarivorans marinus TaxID=561965 RepID=UPI0003FC6448|nr:nuclear transport factor 2 family protein [Aliagarivorans marinus]
MIPLIETLEERLRLAMLYSDTTELSELLADDLVFTNHLGQRMDKLQELDFHRERLFLFHNIELEAMQISPIQQAAVVVVTAQISGMFDGEQANGRFGFSRVWVERNGRWQVLVAHSSLITE